MTDERLGMAAGAWLRDIDRPPRDSHASVRRAMEQARTTRQVRRWWPLPAFDRPLSTLPSRELAPASIPATNGRQPARGFTMLSAVKFVVAGVIVALFGGFLLTGVFTMPQDGDLPPAAVSESPLPMTSEELLAGMDTEEVEPGVYKVTNDGVRDLTSVEAVDVAAGYDDGIWLLREDEFLRLGSDGSHEWPAVGPGAHAFEVAPDGTMWVIPCGARPFTKQCGDALRSTDGDEWAAQPCPEMGTAGDSCQGFAVAPDGTVWTSWRVEWNEWRVGHLEPTGWQPLDGYALSDCPAAGQFNGYRRMFVTDADDTYAMDKCDIFRFENSGWEFFSHQPSWSPYEALVGVGTHGTVWLGFKDDDRLSRWAAGRWEDWDAATVLPGTRYLVGGVDEFRVAPDGSLWSGLWHEADGTNSQQGGHLHHWEEEELVDAVEDGRVACDGLARFDGQTLDHFLPGQCISAMDIAPGGSVVVLASDLGFVTETLGLYVITPETVAPNE